MTRSVTRSASVTAPVGELPALPGIDRTGDVEPVVIGNATLYRGDALTVLQALESESVQCVVTSPPYFGLRDYGHEGQIGLEETPTEYVEKLVSVFREVRRVLRDDGTVWVNLGDSYASSPPGNKTKGVSAKSGLNGINGASGQYRETLDAGHATKRDTSRIPGTKPKDLIGIPWRVAFALQYDGWYLRQDIIWHKPNPMPESVRDRCTKAHEYVFLLSKSARYYYDHESIKEPCRPDTGPRYERGRSDSHKWVDGGPGNQTIARGFDHMKKSGNKARRQGSERGCPEGTGSNVCGSVPWEGSTANKRSVWTITTRPYSGAHFATFPPELPQTCIMAGTKPGDVVLDPFAGAGTTGVVALDLGRLFVGIEISEAYMRDLVITRIDNAQRQGRLAI